ncbi:MAG: hypothetical protein GTO40_11030, partial [Deltaproteobacteria bacterium]|nr:hypothetical protein [Deltaproteobacteria bacterium]
MIRWFNALFLIFLAPTALRAAEIWLRESIVEKYREQILVTIQATPEQIGSKPRSITQDCDLHVPLRSAEIRVAILGEIKNACSQPEGSPASYWSKKLKPLEGKALEAKGVLRVWLEHPPPKGRRQCECDALPQYSNSTPNHMVQLHPLTQLGGVS